jgi:hypothetical protein
MIGNEQRPAGDHGTLLPPPVHATGVGPQASLPPSGRSAVEAVLAMARAHGRRSGAAGAGRTAILQRHARTGVSGD